MPHFTSPLRLVCRVCRVFHHPLPSRGCRERCLMCVTWKSLGFLPSPLYERILVMTRCVCSQRRLVCSLQLNAFERAYCTAKLSSIYIIHLCIYSFISFNFRCFCFDFFLFHVVPFECLFQPPSAARHVRNYMHTYSMKRRQRNNNNKNAGNAIMWNNKNKLTRKANKVYFTCFARHLVALAVCCAIFQISLLLFLYT